MHPEKKHVQIKEEVLCGEKRITCFIRSEGIASEDDENGIDDDSEPLYDGEPYVDDLSEERREQSAGEIMHYLCSERYGLDDEDNDPAYILKMVNIICYCN